MERYVIKDNKKLTYGYTTGSCATAAAKAAAIMLLSCNNTIDSVTLMTPKGFELNLDIEDIDIGKDYISCGVRKNAGDDPDVTNDLLIYAKVSKGNGDEIVIDGGNGVGRITKRGLDQPVGAAAINSVPRKMIYDNVIEICKEYKYSGGLDILISIPGGEEIAANTFNPKLGIVGGLSVLGTSGIVEPMSEQALIDTIRVCMQVKKEEGLKNLIVVPGNYGQDYLKKEYGVDIDTAVKCSNYIGEAIDICVELNFEGMLFTGHLGKLSKVAAGVMNTHSKYGDGRMENLAFFAANAGAEKRVIDAILNCVTTDGAIEVMKEAGICEAVMELTGASIVKKMTERAKGRLNIDVIVFSNEYGTLYKTSGCSKIIKQQRS